MNTRQAFANFARQCWHRVVNWQPEEHGLALRCLVAIVLTAAAVWLRLEVAPPDAGGRYLTLTLAAAVSALYGGFIAGLLSTAMGMVLMNYLMVQPYGSASIDSSVNFVSLNLLHVLTQLMVIGSIALMQRQNRRLRAATAEIQKNQRQLEATFEQGATGMAHNELDGRWIRVNQTYCDMLGYTREQMLSMHYRDFTHPDDLALDMQQLKRTIAGEIQHYGFDKRYIHRLGHVVWVRITISLLRKPTGEPDYLIAVVQDISPSKRTEEALQTSGQLLRQAHAVAGLLSWRVDLTTSRFETLAGSHAMLGLPSANFGAEDLIALTHPEDYPQALRLWKQALKRQARFRIEYRLLSNDKVRWVLVQAEFEYNAQGRATSALGVMRDVTERKQTELQIQQLNTSLEHRIHRRTEALKAAYDELESYSYAVAHDLRSPLRIINGFAQALQEDHPELNAEGLLHLQRITGASKKMGELIDGLLTLSQYARGELQRRSVNLSAIATRLLEEFSSAEPQRQVRWEVQPAMHAQADPALVEALMQNLLHNAWKYTAKSPEAFIRVTAEQEQGPTRFSVSDNGAGFDMARAAKLFQPFQRLHMAHEFTGLGIGLATSLRIVQRHGGELTATAAPGEGAAFHFTLAPRSN